MLCGRYEAIAAHPWLTCLDSAVLLQLFCPCSLAAHQGHLPLSLSCSMPRVCGDSAEGPFQYLSRFNSVRCLHAAFLSQHTVCGGLQAAAGAMMEAAAAEVAEGAAEDAECPACVLPHLARDVSYLFASWQRCVVQLCSGHCDP